MFFSAPKSLCEAFKPLFYINWFMGLGIFLHPEKTVIPYFYILLQTVMINLTNWITIYVGLDELLQDTTDFNNDGQSMNRRNTYRVFHCINAGIVTIAPFLVWHRSKKAKESLRQMMILDDIFKYKLGLKHDYRKIHVYVNSRLIIVVLAMFTMAIYDLSWSLADHRSLFRNYCVSAAVHQPILVMFLLDLNFCTCVTYV
ncbi:uncharacterized protein LOC124309466 [Neodiprion virginianus]|uniref:uncharacterized protein LOC124309466 n=1 Tax=Neodiprion virginianus TaxID=2961670 RepID=UPI001EE69990|nr:uncharacterized protein LOC124309466 [Neodiprion virginianus]